MAIETNLIKITMRYPDRILNPNGGYRSVWWKLRAAENNQRDTAYTLALQAGMPSEPWPALMVHLLLHTKTNCRHDRDNSIFSVKKAIDGFVLAGLLVDDDVVRWGHVEHKKAEPGTKPRVDFMLERLDQ